MLMCKSLAELVLPSLALGVLVPTLMGELVPMARARESWLCFWRGWREAGLVEGWAYQHSYYPGP